MDKVTPLSGRGEEIHQLLLALKRIEVLLKAIKDKLGA